MPFSPQSCSLVVLAILSLPRCTLGQRNWVQLPATPSPTALLAFDMVYDLARDRSVLFGGRSPGPNATVYDETWEHDGTTWIQRSPQTVPSPRTNFRLAMAPGGVLMYGGEPGPLGETWTWDGTDWTQRTPLVSPPPMSRFAMWYDYARNRTVAFGGAAETWAWDGSNWSQLITQTSPPQRGSTHAAYDITRDRAVLFGGGGSSGLLNDTWEFDGVDWHEMTPSTTPNPRWGMKLAYDFFADRTIMHGGNASGLLFAETWEWDGYDWHLITTPSMPAARDNHSISFDWVRQQVMIYGGYPVSDNWMYLHESEGRFTPLGYGCSGSAGTPSLTAAPGSVPMVGQGFDVQLEGLSNQTSAAVGVLGLTELPGLSLLALGMPGCLQFTSFDVGIWMTASGGNATLQLTFPATPSLQGADFYLQAIVFDALANPIGLTVSSAAACTIG